MKQAPTSMRRARALALGTALVLTAACVTVEVKNYAEPQAGLGLEPGDRVVALWRSGFWESTVITVQGKLVTVAWDNPPPDESKVPRGWVQRLDAHPEDLQRGRWLLCPGQQAWQLCYLQGAEQDKVRVLSAANGRDQVWAADEILELPEGVRDWADRYGGRVLEQMAFQQELSTLVPASAGAAVVPQDAVLARWQDGNWWSGKVKKLEASWITVGWPDGSEDAVLRSAYVAPLPAETPQFKAGDFAFCLRDDETRWWQARVERVAGVQIDVTFVDGSASTTAPDRCVPARQVIVP